MLRLAYQEQRWKLEVMEEGLALIQAGDEGDLGQGDSDGRGSESVDSGSLLPTLSVIPEELFAVNEF